MEEQNSVRRSEMSSVVIDDDYGDQVPVEE